VLAMLNGERFVDKPPTQIYATLLAEGTYLCSISTMYSDSGQECAGQRPSPAGLAPAAGGPGVAGHRTEAGLQLGYRAPRGAF